MRRQLEALMIFSLARQLRSRRWHLAGAAFLAILLAGTIGGRQPRDSFAYGIITATILTLQFGIADDRSTGFDRFVPNLAQPRFVFAAGFIATMLMVLAFMIMAGTAASLLWWDAASAAWYAVYWLLIVMLIGAIALIVELLTGIRFPGAVALLLVLIGLFIAYKLDPLLIARLLGNAAVPGAWRPLWPLVVTALLCNAIALVSGYVVWLLRQELLSSHERTRISPRKRPPRQP